MCFGLRVLPLLLASVSITTTGEASMSDRIIPGVVLDSRIAACGVRIVDGKMTSLRPFIEAPATVSGTYRASVKKKSSSGTSMVSQGNAFSAGSLGNSQMAVDGPSEISIQMIVSDTNGVPLCRLDATIVLEAPGTKT
jgi:hypothetical protein